MMKHFVFASEREYEDCMNEGTLKNLQNMIVYKVLMNLPDKCKNSYFTFITIFRASKSKKRRKKADESEKLYVK